MNAFPVVLIWTTNMPHFKWETQMGNECYCGNHYGIYGPSTQCTMTCEGKECGGFGANSVYRTFAVPNQPSMWISDARYCGCWMDGHSESLRVLQHYVGGGFTDQGCVRTCHKRGYNYAGIQEDGPGLGGACYCDSELRRRSRLATTCTCGDVFGNGGDPECTTSCNVDSPSHICWNDQNPCHWCGGQENGLFALNPWVPCHPGVETSPPLSLR
mmetsp:Transcript_9895/g.23412  ORF Transcript_9895/g.23412 Transcript_9895/m.23412 type:complete len:214 (-) Transcript_9895:535-1176(-)